MDVREWHNIYNVRVLFRFIRSQTTQLIRACQIWHFRVLLSRISNLITIYNDGNEFLCLHTFPSTLSRVCKTCFKCFDRFIFTFHVKYSNLLTLILSICVCVCVQLPWITLISRIHTQARNTAHGSNTAMNKNSVARNITVN